MSHVVHLHLLGVELERKHKTLWKRVSVTVPQLHYIAGAPRKVFRVVFHSGFHSDNERSHWIKRQYK